jgi:hypothetical protein
MLSSGRGPSGRFESPWLRRRLAGLACLLFALRALEAAGAERPEMAATVKRLETQLQVRVGEPQ